MVVAVSLHTGCPQPLALTPGICPACAVMSYTMLSLRAIRTHAGGNMIEFQAVAHAPRDVVIGTRRVAAHADFARSPPHRYSSRWRQTLCMGIVRETWQAERICRVSLLRGDDATPWPLIAAAAAREHDGAHDAVAIDDGGPHLQTETTVVLPLRSNQRVTQGRMGREIAARTAA